MANLGVFYSQSKLASIPCIAKPGILGDKENDGIVSINWVSFNKFYKSGLYDFVYEPIHRRQKALEHYLSLFLGLGANWKDIEAVIIDIGSAKPVFRKVVTGMNPKLDIYCVDRTYPPGRNGWMVGTDGSSIDLPDNFADAIVLHCAFEEFEGDSDIALLQTAHRILKPTGKLVIIPFYLSDISIEITDPFDFMFDAVIRKQPIVFSQRYQKALMKNLGHRFMRYYKWEDFVLLLTEARLTGKLLRIDDSDFRWCMIGEKEK